MNCLKPARTFRLRSVGSPANTRAIAGFGWDEPRGAVFRAYGPNHAGDAGLRDLLNLPVRFISLLRVPLLLTLLYLMTRGFDQFICDAPEAIPDLRSCFTASTDRDHKIRLFAFEF
jgi:hypothetical protein